MSGTSEFEGKSGKSGLPKLKPKHLLNASEKLRLGYTTGVEDPDAELDRSAWLGTELGSEQ